ncbi:MAG: hypothetical protein AABX59_01450, partial [Nanoarchaeota archaeon]
KQTEAYPEGLILTPYSLHDVKFHLKVRTIDEKTKFHREELIGDESQGIVHRAFRTYYDSLIRKFSEGDNHMILYST